LLDVDGTLIDSNDQHAESWLETLAAHGFDVPFARVRRLIGMGGDKLLPALTGIASESEQGKAITAQRAALFMRDYLGRTLPFPGVRELVQRMRDDGHALVVASSANARELEALLERAHVRDLIPLKTSSDDAEHSKPDPDIVHAALRQVGSAPEATLMIGDTPYDVAAARRAGVAIIGLTCGGWAEHELEGALAVYRHARELLEHYERSPLAR
jgi:HAD superfamily hydrolase (TIGR01509 family)